MARQEQAAKTKVIGVRLPLEDAKRIETLAAASGLRLSDYMRARLLKDQAYYDVGMLDDVVSVSRQIELECERYLDLLTSLVSQCQDGNSSVLLRIQAEIERAEALMDLAFEAQRQAVQVLLKIRRKIR